MKQLGSDEARRTFRDLLDDAQQGESTEISRNGKPVAILIPAGDSAMKIPPAGHAITIELPGLTAIRIDTAGRVVAIDCISGVANDAEPLSPEWLVRDLRDGTYGGFHRLKPADECFDTECAASGQHVDPANLEIGDPAAGTTETAGANPKLEDFAAPGFAAVRTFKAQGDETP
jgi:prevent-host-death family protein